MVLKNINSKKVYIGMKCFLILKNNIIREVEIVRWETVQGFGNVYCVRRLYSDNGLRKYYPPFRNLRKECDLWIRRSINGICRDKR